MGWTSLMDTREMSGRYQVRHNLSGARGHDKLRGFTHKQIRRKVPDFFEAPPLFVRAPQSGRP